jgi:hexosaminidase
MTISVSSKGQSPFHFSRFIRKRRRSISVGVLCFSTLIASGKAFPRPLTSTARPALLIPMPREYSAREPLSLAHGASIITDGDPEDRFAAHDLRLRLEDSAIRVRSDHAGVLIRMLRTESPEARQLLRAAHLDITPEMHDQGYAIIPSAHGLAVIADTTTGLFYGEQTLKQMIRGHGHTATLQTALIQDWPAMRYRGLSDDLSRGPVPTLAFQENQIRTLAAYKVNIYSPYFESTLQYQSNPVPGIPGGSMSRDDVRTLVAYASQYHVTIIPEQEAFGHLHHVLTCEQYAPLAETPMGSVLAPGQPGSLDVIQQWFDEIAGLFPGPFMHIGADETFDLGKGQTKAAVDQQGLGKVYVDFLTQIHSRLAPLHRRLLFWGDIAVNDPSEVKHLPKDMIAVAWDYAPNPNGYMNWLQPYLNAGIETWVSPGVSDWSRVYPDNDLAMRNIQRFVADGQAAHSTGMLNTVWNDDGQTLFVNDWYGVLFGAAAGWQPGSSDIQQFQAAYGPVFHGDSTGDINAAQQNIISIYEMLRDAQIDDRSDDLYWIDPWSAEGQAIAAKMRPIVRNMRLRAEQAITSIAEARVAGDLRETDALDGLEFGARRLDFIGQKFETADRIAAIYQQAYAAQKDSEGSEHISGLLWNIGGIDGFCADMFNEYSVQHSQYSDLWLRENRPYLLQNVLARFDLATQLWMTRQDRFMKARNDWHEYHVLPSPSDLGIPSVQGN